MEQQSAEATGSPASSPHDHPELMALDAKIKALLPPHYENCYNEIAPESMGSANLKFNSDGTVAWDQIWTTFCDLALAGGPPHRGRLLETVSAEEALAQPAQNDAVVKELARGIWSVTKLPVLPHVAPGWVGIRCTGAAMAAWLVLAIVAENVSARRDGVFLHVPAGPEFKLEKEIKNVITAVAKTCHYWICHISAERMKDESAVAEIFEPAIPKEVRAAPEDYQAVVQQITGGINAATGLPTLPTQYCGWVGVECTNVEMATWLMRALAVDRILVRREDAVLFLPANPKLAIGDNSQVLTTAFVGAHRLWRLYLDAKRSV